MGSTELERADLAAVQALDRLEDTCLSFANHGEDPKGFARMLARIVIESDRHGLDEIPIEQTLRAGVAAERLRSEGLGLDILLELSMAVTAAVSRTLGRQRISDLGRALVLVLTRSYLDAEVAEHQEQKQELRALISISRAVNRTLDPVQVAEAGLRETLRAMRLDAGGIWLSQGGGDSLLLVHTVGVTEAINDRVRAIDVSEFDQVKQAIRAHTAVQFSVDIDDPLLSIYHSALLVPLRGNHGQVGLLAVGSRRERIFDEAEIGFVTAISDHLASALDHAFEHRREAHTDYLTGLANRSEFETSVRRELAGVNRHGRPLSLMLMDLDELKKINDRFGHHAGDEAILMVAQVIRKAVRTSDLSARLGGDEFGIAMPDADLGHAGEVVTRIQSALREQNLSGLTPHNLELSFGLGEWQPGQEYAQLFEVADRNLYRDKRRHVARRARQAALDGKLEESKASSPSTSLPATPSR
jgi:diguanylate cyclase (GGDEF)-like protein